MWRGFGLRALCFGVSGWLDFGLRVSSLRRTVLYGFCSFVSIGWFKKLVCGRGGGGGNGVDG